MCGIAGLIKLKGSTLDTKTQQLLLERLLYGIEPRGGQASGIGCYWFGSERKSHWAKQAAGAERFIQSKFFVQAATMDAHAFFLHSRLATTGSVDNLNNNHPVLTEHCSLVHNGTFSQWNYNKTMERDGLKPMAKTEVDSQIIGLMHDKFKDAREAVKHLDGSFAYALFDDRYNRIQIVKHSNPVVVALIEELKIVLFASTREAIEYAICEFECKYNFFVVRRPRWQANYIEMKDDTLLEFNFTKDSFVADYVQPDSIKSSQSGACNGWYDANGNFHAYWEGEDDELGTPYRGSNNQTIHVKKNSEDGSSGVLVDKVIRVIRNSELPPNRFEISRNLVDDEAGNPFLTMLNLCFKQDIKQGVLGGAKGFIVTLDDKVDNVVRCNRIWMKRKDVCGRFSEIMDTMEAMIGFEDEEARAEEAMTETDISKALDEEAQAALSASADAEIMEQQVTNN